MRRITFILLTSILSAGGVIGCEGFAQGFAQGMSDAMTTVRPQASVITCDQSCSTPINFCYRITCQIKNQGGGAGRVQIAAVYRTSNRGDLIQERTVSLDAWAERSIQIDVRDAKLLDAGRTCLCEVR